MSDRQWTEAQIRAFTSKSPDILVSAAAGSGKTAVLTKRIIDKITDPHSSADISRMLIVTFTKAAAGELKERIRTALSTAMAADPTNKRLERQYLLLGGAKINTIHGFCLDLIRQNYHFLGLSPAIKVSDEVQTSLLMEQVADRVIDNYYSSLPGYDDIDDFIAFADNFVTLQDDKLSQILIRLYKKLSTYTQGISFVADAAEELQKTAVKGLASTVTVKHLFAHYTDVLQYYYTLLDRACREFETTDILSVKYLPAFAYDRDHAGQLLNAITHHDYEAACQLILSYSPLTLSSVKRELQDEESLFFKEVRKNYTALISKKITQHFSDPTEKHLAAAAQSADYVAKLYRFLSAFERKYSYEKRIRGILDFSDLEHLAHRLLFDDNGCPTEIAAQVSADFSEIYIDEYQDVNHIQDDIFSAIAAGSDRFMVGDIKQSIYGFRGADPSLFADYRQKDSVEKIYLSHNFRSDRPIIDFVNRVCGTLFTQFGLTVPYDTSDELVCGKADTEHHPVELSLVTTGKAKSDERRTMEAAYAAKRIRQLIDKGEAPENIVILLRSTSRSALAYEEALLQLGVPCLNRVTKDLFVNPEVLLVMNLLNVIDNPSRDIYLAGALKSPIFKVSLQELITIRRYHPSGSLYDALRAYTADTGFEKGNYFLLKLAEYRAHAACPVHELMWYILCDTKLFAMATGEGSGPDEKKANLMLLYDMARLFESGTFKGLYNFIHYINDLLASGATMPSAVGQGTDNVVRIMTIHQSKGLDFPIVFLCDTASSFNDQDRKENVIIDKDFGITLKLSDPSGLATVDTIFRKAAGIAVLRKSIDEEIRVLYVALTRPKRRLILTAAVADPHERISSCQMLSRFESPETKDMFRQHDNYLDWILLTPNLGVEPQVIPLMISDETEEIPPLPSSEEKAPLDETLISQHLEEFTKRFSFTYRSKPAASLPAKLSVSELYPQILNDDPDSVKLSELRKSNMRRPRFTAETIVSAADRGTATHQFMQFCNLAGLQQVSVEAEIERLIKRGYLDAHTASLVDRQMIANFLTSDLYTELLASSDLRRELRFNIHLPADAFSEERNTKEILAKESILVQGIMDGVFTDKHGRLCILDYKTDRIPCGMSHTDAEAMLVERHREQLSYYRAACERMMCRKVERVILYSFTLSKPLDIPIERLLDI